MMMLVKHRPQHLNDRKDVDNNIHYIDESPAYDSVNIGMTAYLCFFVDFIGMGAFTSPIADCCRAIFPSQIHSIDKPDELISLRRSVLSALVSNLLYRSSVRSITFRCKPISGGVFANLSSPSLQTSSNRTYYLQTATEYITEYWLENLRTQFDFIAFSEYGLEIKDSIPPVM